MNRLTMPAHPCLCSLAVALGLLASGTPTAAAQVAVVGQRVYTMAGQPLENGVVLIQDGKITAIGTADAIAIPDDYRRMEAAVVMPGLVDAHSVVGMAGIYNYDHDQDQLESSKPIQPQLRAVDAYNPREALVAWVRSLGVTTLHTGHGPGELISGQTMVVKTVGNSVEDAVLKAPCAVACTLTSSAQKSGSVSPGTRAKMVAMLRETLLKAQAYQARRQQAEEKGDPAPERDLELETIVRVLDGELPLMVTADRAQDIANAVRLGKEFGIRIWLDSAAESYLLIDEIKAAEVPVIIHPTMARPAGDRENLSFETAGKLAKAGIKLALQSGYESYVPKTRVVLFEGAMAAANGLERERAMSAMTIDAARLLGVDDRVGSLEVGKDGDVALYDGDPFEYTSHCIGVVIDGQVVRDTPR